MSAPRYHVFVCTTGYACHWEKVAAEHRAHAHHRSPEEIAERRRNQPEHANGHVGLHCGEMGGGELFEAFQQALADRGLADVLLTPNACMAQHIAGPVVIVYPDGAWYGRVQQEDIPEIIESHLIQGKPVERLIWREVQTDRAPGIAAAARA